MAEAAAAAAVYETVETTAQLGVGAYMVSKPTMPLKATFTQIATSSDDQTRLSLCRSGHSLSIVKNKAYIFGGETAAGKLASNEMHVVNLEPSDDGPDYSVIPAVPGIGSNKVPEARKGHAACSFNICVAVFGGVDEQNEVVGENLLWLFNTSKSAWETLDTKSGSNAPQPRRDAHLFDHKNNLVLYGGFGAHGQQLQDVWYFSYVGQTWAQLSDAPIATSSAVLSDGSLHLISSSDSVSGDLYSLSIEPSEQQQWNHQPFPANPLTPGPQPRTGAGLLPISTGYGRQYLLYMFGARSNEPPKGAPTEKDVDPGTGNASEQPEFCSDMWTYQLPSSEHEAKVTTKVYEALKPSKIKDTIRDTLGLDSGKHSWAEVEVLPPKDLDATEGKLHPGPRASFACDVMKDGVTLVIWGGVNPKGEREGDGWMIKLQ